MHKTLIAVLIVLALSAPVFANTSASTCMNITVTIEKFVMAAWGGDVTVSITQSAIEAAGNALTALSTEASGSLHIQTNFDTAATFTFNPPTGPRPATTETIKTGFLPATVAIDGGDPFTPAGWAAFPPLVWAQLVLPVTTMGPTAFSGPPEDSQLQGRDFNFAFTIHAKNENGAGLIPSAGTYSGTACVSLVPKT